jgi:hypothetical protein
MEANRSRFSSTQHPTMMELQRGQLEAIRDGDEPSAAAYRLAIFLKLEDAQAATFSPVE